MECGYCQEFFSRFKCTKDFRECDCPPCQGFCECERTKHVNGIRYTPTPRPKTGWLTIRVEMTVRVDREAWYAEYGQVDTDDQIRAQIRDTAKEATEIATRHLPVSIGLHGR